jgi:short subunit fatty acids transporter
VFIKISVDYKNEMIYLYFIYLKRAVLVPAVELLGGVVIAQPRGEKFVAYMNERAGLYEVDTVLADGSVQTSRHQVEACDTLSDSKARSAFLTLPARLSGLRVIGVGITEAGFNIEKLVFVNFIFNVNLVIALQKLANLTKKKNN